MILAWRAKWVVTCIILMTAKTLSAYPTIPACDAFCGFIPQGSLAHTGDLGDCRPAAACPTSMIPYDSFSAGYGCTTLGPSYGCCCYVNTPPPPPPPPPPSPCGPNALCGSIHAMEDPTIALPGIYVQLRDMQGNALSNILTGADGSYSFGLLTAGDAYWIDLILGDNESAQPSRVSAIVPTASTRDFLVIWVPVKITLHGSSGTFVALTRDPVTTYAPPRVGVTGVIDDSGQITLKAPSYLNYATFWSRDPVTGSYVKGTSQALGGLKPRQVLAVTEP